MKREAWARADALFQAALDVDPPERAAWLVRECPDPELRARVERLLRHAEEADAFLPEGGALRDEVLDALEATAVPVAPEGYRWIRRVGEGGMGEVWEAEQTHPVRRRVAVKLVRPGLESASVLARFESERQTLARMSHPHIAQVYDAGTAPDGRPYFVMELVDGEPITAYARGRRLTIEERLRLFLDVCDGVEHAHHKGIVHRDLKPSNVLVARPAGRPVPKIIDFGIARAVDPQASEQTLLTELGQIVGTPDYMSPEQATGDDVDTRADVYALGVLLYELLAESRPFDSEGPSRPSVEEMLRRIREVDPPRPSRRATDSGLARRLRGDLDWIVLKAMEKDRARRYSSPNDLAEDVRRHLRHEPVLAGPPSATYRLSKLIRRHRLAVAAAIAVALALAAGTAVATWQAVRARHAERDAVEQARTAERITEYLVGLFESNDPGSSAGKDVGARELLDRGLRRIREDLGDEPLVRARLELVIADLHVKLGMGKEARDILTDAVETRRELLGPSHPETIRAVYALARAQAAARDDTVAEATFREAERLFAGVPGGDPAEVFDVRLDLADVVRRRGRYPEAESLYRDALEALTRLRGPDDPSVAKAWNGLAIALYRQDRLADAEPAYRRALELKERIYGPEHYQVAMTLTALAGTVGRLGRDDEAELLSRRAVAIYEKVFGGPHNLLASALMNLAGLYGRQGRYAEAESLYRRSAEMTETLFGRDHPETAIAYTNLAALHIVTGEATKARRELERVLPIHEAAFGGKGDVVAWCLNCLGELERQYGSPDRAEGYFRRALAAMEAVDGAGLLESIRARAGLADLAGSRGRRAEAEAGIRAAVAEIEALSPEHPELPERLEQLADLVLSRGAIAEAERLLDRALALQRRTLREGHPDFSATWRRMSALRLAQGNRAEAERLALEAERVALGAFSETHPDVVRAREALARARQGAPNPLPHSQDGMQKSVSVGTSAAPAREKPSA